MQTDRDSGEGPVTLVDIQRSWAIRGHVVGKCEDVRSLKKSSKRALYPLPLWESVPNLLLLSGFPDDHQTEVHPAANRRQPSTLETWIVQTWNLRACKRLQAQAAQVTLTLVTCVHESARFSGKGLTPLPPKKASHCFAMFVSSATSSLISAAIADLRLWFPFIRLGPGRATASITKLGVLLPPTRLELGT